MIGEPMLIGDLVSGIWDNPFVFVILVTVLVGAIGMITGSLAVGSWAAFMSFAFFATETPISWIEQLLYVILVLIFVGFAFKIWRLEGGGGVGS